ncbi:MAG: adenylate kinase [archaeon]
MKKIFLGAPGSGKGTAASKIAPKRNVPHISTGDLFRENINKKTPIGAKAKEYIEKGELAPDEIVIEMLKKRIQQEDCQNGFILDGFPRTISQAEKLSKLTNIDLVINISVPKEIIIQRLSSRITCKECGKIFNAIYHKPKNESKCDQCHGEIIRRPDDKPEIIQNRLKIYEEQTAPLIEFYKSKGILQNILCDDINKPADETAQLIINSIKEFSNKISQIILPSNLSSLASSSCSSKSH